MGSVTSDVVEWSSSVTLADIPPEVIAEARRGLVDAIGVAVRGAASSEWLSIARSLGLGTVTSRDANGAARVLGREGTTSAYHSALLNGTAAMALELDDGYSPGGAHPSPPTLAACFASDTDVDLDRFLVAYIVGCEIVCRVSRAGHPEALARGFHMTPIAGVVGATVANSIIRATTPGVLWNAVGISGSFAGGLFEFMVGGAGVKRIHAGKAAADGTLAVDLALAGLTGPRTVLEGDNGLLRAFAGATSSRVATVAAGLGTDWAILDRYMKIYPCARHSHGPVDVVIDLCQQHSINNAEQIECIDVETYETALKLSHFGNATTLDAQMSMPYAIAAAIVHRRLTLQEFAADSLNDPRVKALADLITFTKNDTMDEAYPTRRPARVTITVVGGARFTGEVEGPYGEPYRPIPDDVLKKKFMELCAPVVGDAAAAAARRGLVEMESRGAFGAALNGLLLR